MATLIVNETSDFRPGSLANITGIAFNTSEFASATFGSDQFGSGEISNDVAINGDDNVNHIRVVLSAPGAFSAGSWTFSDWRNNELFGNDLVAIDGTAGNDTITGSSQTDQIVGNEGKDILRGGAGDDLLGVGAGDLVAGEVYDGGSQFSRDRLTIFEAGNFNLASVTITGIEQLLLSNLDGSVTAILRGDQIGGAGISAVDGAVDRTQAIVVQGSIEVDLSGVDFIDWGGAAQTITISGTNFSDTLIGSREDDAIAGLASPDVVKGQNGDDSLDGGDGNDTLDGGTGNDAMAGGNGIDTASYATATATVTVDLSLIGPQATGGAGTDTLSGIENLTGSAFADTLAGNDGINVLSGLAGNDTIDGGIGIDQLFGGGGNDRLLGGRNSDRLEGGDGNDRLVDDSGNDIMSGGGGDDRLVGGISNDTLAGGTGADTLNAGADDDRLIGGLGRDLLVGGAGDDRFDFNDVAESGKTSATRDEIRDFTHIADRIDLSTIDAVAGGSNDAFAFIGSGAFTAAGQVRAVQFGADTILLINTEGAGGAEMTIGLSNFTASTLTNGDFIV